MICFIAMIVFGILGIFSATHRKVALEAFDCVFRKVTLRKCNTGLDTRLKSSITGKFLRKKPRLGKFIYKNFEIISGIFTILLIGSLIWTGISGYNYYVYGNCNGPSVEDQQGLCLFDPTGENSEISQCDNEDIHVQTVGSEPSLTDVNLKTFPQYDSKFNQDTIVYVGCYTCTNTRKVNPTINQLVVENKGAVDFVFIHLPLHKNHEYISKISNCLFEKSKVAFWKFHNSLMQINVNDLKNQEKVYSLLDDIEEIDKPEIVFCSQTKQADQLLEDQINQIQKMNVQGTPTIFVNEQVFIGSKPLRVYERALSTHVDWFGYGLVGLGTLIILIILYFAVFKRN